MPVKNLKLRDDGSEIGFDRDVWKQIVELGFAGYDSENGRHRFRADGRRHCHAGAGRTLAASPLYSTAVLGAGMIMAAGSENQKKSFCRKLPPANYCWHWR